MILGRPANLWLAAFTAIFNVGVLSHFAGMAPGADVVSSVNIAAASVIGLLAFKNGNGGSAHK